MSELTFREGRASDLEAAYGLGERALGSVPRDRGLIGPCTRRGRTEDSSASALAHERPLLEFMTAPAGRLLPRRRGRRRDRRLRARRALSRHGRDGRAVGRARRTRAGASARGLLERCWPELADARARPGRGRGGRARRPDAVHRVRRHAGERPLAHAPPGGPVPRAPRAGGRRRPSPAFTCSRPTARWRSGSASSRPRSATSASALHEFFGRTRNCLATVDDDGPRHRALLGERPRRDRTGGGEEPRGPRARWCWPRSTAWRRCRSRRRFGVHFTTAAWWLMDRLRRLGFRVHWPAWIMSSVPLPGLDRYLATRPVEIALAGP